MLKAKVSYVISVFSILTLLHLNQTEMDWWEDEVVFTLYTVNPQFKPRGLINFMVHNHLG